MATVTSTQFNLEKFIKNILAFILMASVAALAKKDKPDYQVGLVTTNTEVADQSVINADGGCGIGGCTTGTATRLAHHVTTVQTPDGTYAIDSPVSVGGGLVLGMMTGSAPTVHKQWFMDNLKTGDKVLFAAKCNNHNSCVITVPNPDNPKKEYSTAEIFTPNVAKTNANALCGTGRLTAAVEAQVCNQPVPMPPAEATPTTPDAPAPDASAKTAPTPATASVPKASAPTDPRMQQFKRMCDSGMFKNQPQQQQMCDVTFPKQ